jgi:cell division protein FtsA
VTEAVKKPEPILAIDIGTTKVCALIAADCHPAEPEVLGVGLAPSIGLNRGAVVDLQATSVAIQEAVEKASAMAGFRCRQGVVGIAGGFIRGYNGHGSVVVASRSRGITAQDVQAAVRDAVQKEVPAEMEVIHALPREFRVDDTSGIDDPTGMHGTLLEADLHLVAGSRSALRTVRRAVTSAGLKVEELVLEPVASSLSVLEEAEKAAGIAMVDIGGGTSDLAVFIDGILRHTEVILIGGDYITKDISKAFVTPFESAETLKIRFGGASSNEVDVSEQVEVQRAKKTQPVLVQRRELNWVIEARVEQILQEIHRALEERGFANGLRGGLVLTGGTALLEGIKEKANRCLGCDVAIGFPNGVSGYSEVVRNPIYATVVGLVHFGLAERRRRTNGGRHAWGSAWNWVKRVMRDTF